MSTAIVINTAVINYNIGTTDCQCSEQVQTLAGLSYIGLSVTLASADLAPDWTDDQLCVAVASKLNIPVADVSVAVPVVPPEPPAPVVPPVDPPEPDPVPPSGN